MSLGKRAIVIGCIVFITAFIAQIWIWDIFGHIKMSNPISDASFTQNVTTSTTNCSQFDKCVCKKRTVDMSFITGELARKHVEERFSNTTRY